MKILRLKHSFLFIKINTKNDNIVDPRILSPQMKRNPQKILFLKLNPLYLRNGILFFQKFGYIFTDDIKL